MKLKLITLAVVSAVSLCRAQITQPDSADDMNKDRLADRATTQTTQPAPAEYPVFYMGHLYQNCSLVSVSKDGGTVIFKTGEGTMLDAVWSKLPASTQNLFATAYQAAVASSQPTPTPAPQAIPLSVEFISQNQDGVIAYFSVGRIVEPSLPYIADPEAGMSENMAAAKAESDSQAAQRRHPVSWSPVGQALIINLPGADQMAASDTVTGLFVREGVYQMHEPRFTGLPRIPKYRYIGPLQ